MDALSFEIKKTSTRISWHAIIFITFFLNTWNFAEQKKIYVE